VLFSPSRYALAKGATFSAVDLDEEDGKAECVKANGEGNGSGDSSKSSYSLFAFPGECNFSGVKYSLDRVSFYRSKQEVTHKYIYPMSNSYQSPSQSALADGGWFWLIARLSPQTLKSISLVIQ